MNKKWEYYKIDNNKINEISEKHKISKLLAQVILNRGIVENVDMFFKPTREDFYDPFLMTDMKKAVERIIKAINQKEQIVIFGDYDVDGITSTTVLKKFLEDIGVQAKYTIPNRLSEGYGLHKEALRTIKDEGGNLVITVDCGITAIEEVAFANSIGLDVIITDHHEPIDELPNALAIVNAKRKDSIYPFRNLAGVGTVFKLIQALTKRLGLPDKLFLQYLDIVAVGTISDIVPLVDENRVITKLGLKLLNETRNIGLKELIKMLGFETLNSYSVAFAIAPRINACGRLGHEKEAVNLFLTDSEEEAKAITLKLSQYNTKRQAIEKDIFEDAIQKIEKEDLKNKNSIILWDENWNHGVIGIVASRITEKFSKPTILIACEDGIGKGSGRSIPCFDLHEALNKTSKYLEQYGGHALAIGLSIKQENLEKFKNAFEEYANTKEVKEYIPTIKIDAEITAKDININSVDEIKKLEPFGESNKMPIFIYNNVKINSIRTLSEGRHLKLSLCDGSTFVDAIRI